MQLAFAEVTNVKQTYGTSVEIENVVLIDTQVERRGIQRDGLGQLPALAGLHIHSISLHTSETVRRIKNVRATVAGEMTVAGGQNTRMGRIGQAIHSEFGSRGGIPL